MSENDEIHAAQEMLLEALRAHAQELRETGGEALKAGQLDAAEEIVARAKAIQAILEEQQALAERLRKVLGQEEPVPPASGPTTPHSRYRIPVLQAVVDLGGRAETAAALERVHVLMADVLTPADHEPVPSGRRIRWKSGAAWMRFRLVKEGLLAADSPYGLWEITEAGRRWLEEYD